MSLDDFKQKLNHASNVSIRDGFYKQTANIQPVAPRQLMANGLTGADFSDMGNLYHDSHLVNPQTQPNTSPGHQQYSGGQAPFPFMGGMNG